MQEKPKITLELIYASLQTIQFEINEIRLDQIRTNNQYRQIEGRMAGIENNIKEIYDRLVTFEERGALSA